MAYQWDPEKADSNLKKHGIDFTDRERKFMKEKEYDFFDDAEQGAIVKPARGKTRITIRIDTDILKLVPATKFIRLVAVTIKR